MMLEIKKIIPVHSDERGSIADIIDDENIQHVGRISCKKGSIRGSHYHKQSRQYTYVLFGRIRIIIKNLKEDSQLEIISLRENELVLIPAFWYHSIEALVDSEIMVFTSKSRGAGGYENDTFRVENINNFKLEKNNL